MSEERSFVQQIREDPHDDTPRLIYADFLEDAGDPQGELIRVQVELANLPVGDERRSALVQRETELLAEHGQPWLAPLRKLGVQGVSVRCFQRGLVERAKIPTARFLEIGHELCDIAPALHCLELLDVAPAAARVAEYDLPLQITSLDLSAKRLRAMELGMLRGAAWFDRIESLNLAANRLGDDGVDILTGRDYEKLTSLHLDMNQLGPDAATSLAGWPTLGQLTRLSLSVNQLGALGVNRLASSMFLGQLRRIDLASNRIGETGIGFWENAPGFDSLRELNLRNNAIGPAAMQAFSRSSVAHQLTGFDARGNHPDTLKALAEVLPAGVLRPLV